jgi:rhodanese-related sulfurtransferase
MTIAVISPTELEERRRKGEAIELIDVRTPAEFQEVHVEYARNLPLDQLNPGELLAHRGSSGERPLYVICRSGSRGSKACERLLAGGFPQVVNVEGGTLACVQAGLPVVRGKKMMSLERQVRVTAGGLVLAGALLTYLVNPWFWVLPAFVGAGLMFAGITDSCAMGLLLAKMPWNRAGEQPTSCRS